MSARIERFDRDWSRFRDDSAVARISREPGSHLLPDDAPPLLSFYRELYAATGGRVSPLVGRTLESAGYDAAYRLVPAATRAPVPAWDDAIAWDGERALDAAQPVVIDVGAAGKGYLVDLVGTMLRERGIRRFIVDASGDLAARDVAMRVALEHPADPSKAIGIVELADAALCASAPNRRAWGDGEHHIIDALTGRPTVAVIATWALAPTALVADGVATALFFDVDPNLLARHHVEYVRMYADGRVEHSPSFPGELFE